MYAKLRVKSQYVPFKNQAVYIKSRSIICSTVTERWGLVGLWVLYARLMTSVLLLLYQRNTWGVRQCCLFAAGRCPADWGQFSLRTRRCPVTLMSVITFSREMALGCPTVRGGRGLKVCCPAADNRAIGRFGDQVERGIVGREFRNLLSGWLRASVGDNEEDIRRSSVVQLNCRSRPMLSLPKSSQKPLQHYYTL